MVPHLTGPLPHWSPNWHPWTPHFIGPTLIAPLPPTHWSPPLTLVPHPHLICPFSPAGAPIHKSPLHCLNSLVLHLIDPPMLPYCPVPIDRPSHWSPNVTLVTQLSLVPHLIGYGLPLVTFPTLLSLVPHLIGPISGPKGLVLSTPQILDPSIKDWYQYQPWNHTHRAQLTYHKAEYYQIAAVARPNGRWSISGLYGWDFMADIDINWGRGRGRGVY